MRKGVMMKGNVLALLLLSFGLLQHPSVQGFHTISPRQGSCGIGGCNCLVTTRCSTLLESSASPSATTTESSTDERAPSTATATITTTTPEAKDPVTDEKKLSPGADENEFFQCDDTVYFWRDFQRDGFGSDTENLKQIVQVGERFRSRHGLDGLEYWLKHFVGRTGYFVTNAALGTLGSTVHDRLIVRDQTENPFVRGIASSASRLILEAALSYEQDYQRIQKGWYKKPYDMYENTRQSNPSFIVGQTNRFVREAIGTLTRRKRRTDRDKKVWLNDEDDNISMDHTKLMYPDYYLNAFHYQTDGWLSKTSADAYETSTETLFLGRQDAMQRTALPALVNKFRSHCKNNKTGKQRPFRVLEVACGTGRFMTFARDNLLRVQLEESDSNTGVDVEYTALDLSPFYLEKARENYQEWVKMKTKTNGSGRRTDRRNGSQLSKDDITPTRFVQAPAERLPFADESFDAVICIYLFHELPRKIRAQVVSEMSRVVIGGVGDKDGSGDTNDPAGLVIFTDSIQLGDRPVLDQGLYNFENMNEPYYGDYIEDNLLHHFVDTAGIQPKTKMVCSTTKTLTFEKKLEQNNMR